MLPNQIPNTSTCSPISSNCVIWQGPDIPCIQLCNGDTVSDVIAKLATQLCALIDQSCECEPDLSGLDLKCTLPVGGTAPQTLEATIQLIVDYVCSIQPGGSTTLPDVALPPCLQFVDGLGNPVTALRLDLYAAYLANKICDILSSISIIQNTLSNHESRIVTLENCVLPCTPSTPLEVQVLPQCVLSSTTLVNLSTLTLAIESAFCNFRSSVGTVPQLSAAIAQQCVFGTSPTLSTSGTYGSLSGWQNTSSTLAQAVRNLWIVTCDMYSAVTDIKANCCTTGCASVTFAYTYSIVTDGFGVPTDVVLNFTGSSIPTTYNDCGTSTLISIKDSNGSVITTTANISSLQFTPGGLSISLTGLNVTSSISVTVNFCATDGVNSCSEKMTQIIPLQIPCPTGVVTTPGINNVGVSFANGLGTTPIYTIQIVDATTSVVAATSIVTLPGPSVNVNLSGLASFTSYNVIITVQKDGSTIICPSSTFTTNPAGSYLLVEDCATSTVFTVDPLAAPVTVGMYHEMTNTGSSISGWISGDTKCVQVLGYTAATPSTTVSVSTSYSTCSCAAAYTVTECVTIGPVFTYNIAAEFGSLPLSPGDVIQYTNVGVALPDWPLNETRCVEIVAVNPTTIDTTVTTGAQFPDCSGCTTASTIAVRNCINSNEYLIYDVVNPATAVGDVYTITNTSITDYPDWANGTDSCFEVIISTTSTLIVPGTLGTNHGPAPGGCPTCISTL